MTTTTVYVRRTGSGGHPTNVTTNPWDAAWELIRAGDLLRTATWAGRNTPHDHDRHAIALAAYEAAAAQ